MNSARLRLSAIVLGLCVCPPAFADFGPQVAHALWLLLTFVGALIALPCIAPRGWRLFWFLCVLIGFPLSMSLLGRFVMWLATANFAGDATLEWLTVITWCWIVCVVTWNRLTGLLTATAASNDDSTIDARPLPRAADLVAILTIAALLFDGQLLVPRFSPLDLLAVVGLTTVYVGLPLIAAMGLWRQQRWAWWLATACVLAQTCTTIYFNSTALAKLVEPQGEGILVQALLAVNNPALLSLVLRVALLALLMFKLRPRSSESPGSAP